jgi:hypothetical protein
MFSDVKKRMKYAVSVGRIPGSQMGEWGNGSSHGKPRDASVELADEERRLGAQAGAELYAKHGGNINPNTQNFKSELDMVTDNVYHAIYPNAPHHIKVSNSPAAYAWVRIRRYVADAYRETTMRHEGGHKYHPGAFGREYPKPR